MDIQLEQATLFFLAAGLLVAAPGCSQSTQGPCSVTKNGPALIVSSVSDSETGAQLDSVIVQDIMVNGYAPPRIEDAGLSGYDAGSSTDAGDVDGGTQSDTISYRCDLPCGITDTQGDVEFTLMAEGYAPKQVTTTADYQSAAGGGCPTSLSDGAEIEIELDPVSQE